LLCLQAKQITNLKPLELEVCTPGCTPRGTLAASGGFPALSASEFYQHPGQPGPFRGPGVSSVLTEPQAQVRAESERLYPSPNTGTVALIPSSLG
jgi:hypothetical protein